MENKLIQELVRVLSNAQDLEGWRCSLTYTNQIESSLRKSKFGGPYGPPSVRNEVSGTLFLRWKDRKVTKCLLNAPDLGNLSQSMQNWKEQAFFDKAAPKILPPQKPNKVKVFDQAITRLFENSTPLFALLESYQKIFSQYKVPNVDATVSAEFRKTFLRSSRGMNVDILSTAMATYISANGQYSETKDSRKLITKEEAEALAYRVAKAYTSSRSQKRIHTGTMEVIFSAEVTNDLVDQYMGENLSGSAVAENESAFVPADFRFQKKKFPAHLSYILDSREDFDVTSYPIDAEGTPGGKHYLVKSGKLQTPELDLKYAGMLKMKATGTGRKYLFVKNAKPYEEIISKIKDGILVHTVLGIHTQNPVTGEFSLPAYLCERIVNGKSIGGCKATISGNFFEVLNSGTFGKVKYNPKKYALKTMCKVAFLQ